MEIRAETRNGVFWIRFGEGRLDGTVEGALGQKLEGAGETLKRFVLDMREVSDVGSSGIVLLKRIEKEYGDSRVIFLLGPGDKTFSASSWQKAFKDLLPTFRWCDSEDEIHKDLRGMKAGAV
jgi:hypothetical protein